MMGSSMASSYEIFKKSPAGIFVWIESAKDPESGKERVKQLALESPGEYKLFCKKTRRVIAVDEKSATFPSDLQKSINDLSAEDKKSLGLP
jgi:hypothetical protein